LPEAPSWIGASLAAAAVALALHAAPAAAEGAPAPAPPTATSLPDAPYAEALAPLGLAPADLRLDEEMVAVFGQDRFRLPLWGLLASDARRAPGIAHALRDHALEAARDPSEAVLFVMSRIQARVRRSLLGDPIADLARMAKEPGALAEAIAAIHEVAAQGSPQGAGAAGGQAGAASPGGPALPKEELFRLRQAAATLPPEVAEAAALVLLSELRFLSWRGRAFARVPAREQDALVNLSGLFTSESSGHDGSGSAHPAFAEAAERVDFTALAAGAFDVVHAVERVLPALREASEALAAPASATMTAAAPARAPYHFRAETPLGFVEIDGRATTPTRTADRLPLLVIDLAGPDRYETAGAARGPRAPVSVTIDTAGDDAYDTGDPSLGHTLGAGVLGLGVLVDAAGSDAYRAGPLALGAGLLGIGLLWDGAGDDAYEGETYTQGAAAFGGGALVDAAGADRYLCLDRSQGFGGVLGSGLLCDAAGDDRYTADDSTIRRPSPQSREHNTSLAQGAATGVRADTTDGRSLAGGFGMLVDGGGDDAYRAGVFAQGTGYWYGVGILADRAGNDTYGGAWYVQGAGAHFAAGILHDAAGDDRYTATLNAAQGLGHDFSLGLLYEGGGDDAYLAPTLSLGAGNASGLGMFVDRGGRDRYALAPGAATVLGESRVSASKPYDLRRWGRTLGLFLDLGGGADTYPEGKGGDGRAWVQPRDADLPDDLNAWGALGAGVDR